MRCLRSQLRWLWLSTVSGSGRQAFVEWLKPSSDSLRIASKFPRIHGSERQKSRWCSLPEPNHSLSSLSQSSRLSFPVLIFLFSPRGRKLFLLFLCVAAAYIAKFSFFTFPPSEEEKPFFVPFENCDRKGEKGNETKGKSENCFLLSEFYSIGSSSFSLFDARTNRQRMIIFQLTLLASKCLFVVTLFRRVMNREHSLDLSTGHLQSAAFMSPSGVKNNFSLSTKDEQITFGFVWLCSVLFSDDSQLLFARLIYSFRVKFLLLLSFYYFFARRPSCVCSAKLFPSHICTSSLCKNVADAAKTWRGMVDGGEEFPRVRLLRQILRGGAKRVAVNTRAIKLN